MFVEDVEKHAALCYLRWPLFWLDICKFRAFPFAFKLYPGPWVRPLTEYWAGGADLDHIGVRFSFDSHPERPRPLPFRGGGGWTWLGETLALFSDLIMQAVVWVQYRSYVYPQCRIGEESWRVWRWLIIPDPSSFASTVLLNHVLIYATSIEYF